MSDELKLDYLVEIANALATDDPNFDYKAFKSNLTEALEKAKSEATTKKQRDEIDKSVENLAKALPAITKGTLSAIKAFKSGDPISGSAAIMDICSSLAPLLGGLAAAGGPPGMIVGAIFSIIGQILSFFAPESKALTEKIEDLLRDLHAEKTQSDIRKVHQTIGLYASALRDAADSLTNESDDRLLDLEITRGTVTALNFLEGNTLDGYRDVINWLNIEQNQSLDLWPTILNAACQAWADMNIAALTMLSLLTEHVQKQYAEAKKIDSAEDRRNIANTLTKLQAEVITRLRFLKGQNDFVIAKLKEIRPAMRNRGMFWLIADSRTKQLYAGTNIRQGIFANLEGEQKKVTVAVPNKYISLPDPIYYLIGLEPWGSNGYDRTYVSEIKPPYKSQVGKQLFDESGNDQQAFHGLSDVWAEPSNQSKDEIWFYTAKGKSINGYVLNVDKAIDRARHSTYTRMTDYDITSLRVLHDPQPLPDDPDNAGGNLAGINYCAYAGLARENATIYVDCGEGTPGYVPSPWRGYDGLGIDQHYLWVFGSAGFACATHASVVRCLREKKGQPRWMEHYPNDLLYVGDQKDGATFAREPLKGLVDLCPCEDGTIVAAIYRRSGIIPGVSSLLVDKNALYSGVHSTDIKKQKISVEWTQIEVSTGVGVRKLPAFGWSLFEGLPVMLDQLAPGFAQRGRRNGGSKPASV